MAVLLNKFARSARGAVIANLGLGFAVALTIQNIAYCFIGVLLGTIIGVLPTCMPALPAASTPKVLEPMRCQLGVAHGMLDILVAEPSL